MHSKPAATPALTWGRRPADRWFLGLLAAAGAALAAGAWIRDPSHAAVYALFLVLHVFCYLPVTAIALNAARLHGLLRYFFALTAIPAFVLLLLCSIYLISGEFPSYYESYNRAAAGCSGTSTATCGTCCSRRRLNMAA